MIDVTKTPLDEIFGYNTKESELTEVCKFIINTFVKPKFSSIPKEYYPFLYKLISYRKYDYRGNYKPGDIKTFYVGKDEYGKNSIAFFDNEGHHDFLGCTKAISQWQKEKINEWEHMKGCVLTILRNLARIRIKEKRDSIILPVKCEITGKIIENLEDIHIDHYDDDFSKVAYDWMYSLKQAMQKQFHKSVDIINVLYNLHDDNYRYFKFKNWNKAFIDFHDSHTHLRVVCKEANLKKEKYKPNWDFLKINGYFLEKYAKEKEFNQ